MKLWSNYLTDLGFNYPFLAVSIRQISTISRIDSPLIVLPGEDLEQIVTLDNSCRVSQLTPRKIKVYFSDDSIYEFNYYRPFNSDLFDNLSSSISVRAFEFIGERIRYSRLTKMMNRG